MKRLVLQGFKNMNRSELIRALEASLIENKEELFLFAVEALHPADAASVLEAWGREEPSNMKLAAEMLEKLGECAAARLFSFLPQYQQLELFRLLGSGAKMQLLENLSTDDAADLVGMMKKEEADAALSLMNPERASLLKELASYPEGSCGSEMCAGFTALEETDTLAQAVQKARRCAARSDLVYILYVLDGEGRLVGTLSLRDVLSGDPSSLAVEAMMMNPVFAYADEDAGKAVEMIRRYDLMALPVASRSGKMVGVITVDDAIDAGIEETASDLARFGGSASLGSNDLDLRKSGFARMFSVRVFWLVVLTLFGMATSTFVAAQQEMLEQAIVLAAFIAPIVDMGGNAGSQSATLVLRGMALGSLDLKWRDVWFVVKKEVPVAAGLGVAVAVLEAALAGLGKGVGSEVLMVVACAMALCTLLGGVTGALLPFLAKRVGADPATLSSPLITSIMDLVGVFIYFALAYCFMGDALGL